MKLICIGDSLTSGLGVEIHKIWTERLCHETGYEVINKGISGDTTGGMLARFGRDVLDQHPDRVLIIGGSNDFIIGSDTTPVKVNLMAMVHQARAARIDVILGTAIPADLANVREDWRHFSDFALVEQKQKEMQGWIHEFGQVFQVPSIDLYSGFKNRTSHSKEHYYIDGIHPNGRGHQIMAEIILESIQGKR